MGTRSLTIFEDREEIAVLYRQYDGYPSGHGRELAEFLSGYRVTDGKFLDPRTANGMSCLAAQIVAHFKTESGGFYLYPAGTRNAGEEFRYTVYGVAPMEPRIRAEDVTSFEMALKGETVVLLFDGPASAMVTWLDETYGKEATP